MGSVSAAVVSSVPRGKPNMSSTPDIILAREGTGGASRTYRHSIVTRQLQQDVWIFLYKKVSRQRQGSTPKPVQSVP